MKLARAAVVLLAVSAPASSALADKTPSCIKWWGQTVQTAVGNNHVVYIENSCDRAASCNVSTDVAPDPIQASVQPKQRTELVTFRGSPAFTFKPKVECKLE
jgi:hypothetical protein